MDLLKHIKRLVADPPPEYVFEISEQGISYVATESPAETRFVPLDEGVLKVGPLEDNVADVVRFARAVDSLVPQNGSRRNRTRRAAVLVPDFAARVSVFEFDSFPSVPSEQTALARFRAKKTVPFDIDSAVVACHPQPRSGTKKLDVVAAILNMEVAAHYEAPFRAAGFQCGFIGVSALAALSLDGGADAGSRDPVVVAKRSRNALAVALLDKGSLRMYRCLELAEVSAAEFADILIPTLAYAEDHLSARPAAMLTCGFGAEGGAQVEQWCREAGLPVGALRSRFGAVSSLNAGLLGYLESLEGRL